MQHFAANHFAAWHFASAQLQGGLEAPAVPAITTAGPHRGFGTQYRAKTISRERREEERAAKRAAKKVRTRVVAALRKQDWFDDPELAKAAVNYVDEAVSTTFMPQFIEDGVGDIIMDAAIRFLIREAFRIAAEQDDDDLLLLAA
jgi:hypothetical protein